MDVANVSQVEHDRRYVETIRRLMPFESRSVVWRLTSKEAAELIPDASVDFCYLDGDHSFEGVSTDIRLWYPKLRVGGILGGHDHIPDGNYEFGAFGVRRAVTELVAKTAAPLFLSDEPDNEFPSWFVLKRCGGLIGKSA